MPILIAAQDGDYVYTLASTTDRSKLALYQPLILSLIRFRADEANAALAEFSVHGPVLRARTFRVLELFEAYGKNKGPRSKFGRGLADLQARLEAILSDSAHVARQLHVHPHDAARDTSRLLPGGLA